MQHCAQENKRTVSSKAFSYTIKLQLEKHTAGKCLVSSSCTFEFGPCSKKKGLGDGVGSLLSPHTKSWASSWCYAANNPAVLTSTDHNCSIGDVGWHKFKRFKGKKKSFSFSQEDQIISEHWISDTVHMEFSFCFRSLF